jgi:uncharacterized protein (DUF305 family)
MLLLAFGAVASAAGVAVAQINASPATQAYMQAMQTLNDKMKGVAPSGDPNKDFVLMMTPHHQAAVDMAEAYLKYGKDPQLTRLANDIISSQTKEIKEMTAWQTKHGR